MFKALLSKDAGGSPVGEAKEIRGAGILEAFPLEAEEEGEIGSRGAGIWGTLPPRLELGAAGSSGMGI